MGMDINLFTNAVPDIPRIVTALAEWAACVGALFVLKPRFEIKKNTALLLLMGIVQCVFMVVTGHLQLVFWVPCMIMAFGLMYMTIFFTCKINAKNALYFAMPAFIMAELSASIFWQVHSFIFESGTRLSQISEFGIMFGVYLIVEFVGWSLIKGHIPNDGNLELGNKSYLAAGVITFAVFSMSNMNFVLTNTPFSAQYSAEIRNARTLVDIGGVAILYAHLIQSCDAKIRRELEAIQNVLQNQYAQYKLSRDTVDLINYKYHDLKHQIAVLRREEDPEKRNAYLDQMEEEIRQYDLQNKTGNSVLDTILTGKSLYCNKHGIAMTTVADGTLLSFMSTMDIASIFGNALDNAIESVLTLKEKEKRLIHVTVAKQKGFLLIHVENYFEGSLDFKEGNRLATTKRDKRNHGYGIESIKYIVNKYEGAVTINAVDNWFYLKILIPISVQEEKTLEQV